MSKLQDLDNLRATGQASEIPRVMPKVEPPKMSRADLLNHLSEHLWQFYFHREFRPVRFIEWMPGWWLRRKSTIGTALEPVVKELVSLGYDAEQNLGSVMQHTDMTKDQIHDTVCGCHGSRVTGATYASRIRAAI